MRNFSIGWRQVWLSMILLAGVSMMPMAYGVIAISLMEEFNPSRMVLMLTMAVTAVVTAAASPWAGALMDRFSLRWIVIYGAVNLVLGYFLLSFVQHFYQVLIVYGLFLAPAQVAAGPLAATVLLSRWFSDQRGRALGLALTGLSIGAFVFPLVVQVLVDTFTWREAMQVLAAILALMALPAALLVINSPSDRGLHADGAAEDPERGDAGAVETGPSTKSILTDSTFWLLAMIFAVFFSGMRGLITNVASLATDEGIDPALVAYPLSAYAAAGIFAKLGFAWIADRTSARTLLLVALFGAGLSHTLMVFAEQGFAVIMAGAALLGFFGGMILPLQSYVVPKIFGRNVVGRVIGLMGLAMFVFNAASPPLFGLIFDLFGSYDVIFIVYIGLIIASVLAVPKIRFHLRPNAAPGQGLPVAD